MPFFNVTFAKKPLLMPPKSRTIYLIRHGETEYNRLGMVQGSGIDSDLNEIGRAQAAAFFEHFKQIPFKKIYTSKLKRTHQSVAKFIELGLPWEQHEGLNEISWGNTEGHTASPETDQVYYQILAAWRNGDTNLAVNGGESPNEVAARQKPFLDLIDSKPDEDPILICMHGRAIRILLCGLLKLPLSRMDMFEHRNLCLYKLQQITDGSWEIRLSNFVVHPPAPY